MQSANGDIMLRHVLTHLPLVMHESVHWINIGAGNGSSPVRCQAITWTHVDLLSIRPIGTNFCEVWTKIPTFCFHENACENVVCEIETILFRGREWVKYNMFSCLWRRKFGQEAQGTTSYSAGAHSVWGLVQACHVNFTKFIVMHKTCSIMAIFDNDLLFLHCAISPLNFKPMRSLKNQKGNVVLHDDVNKWKHFPRSLQWRQNGHDGVSNHHPHDCLLNRLFGRRSKKTSKLRVTGLCAGKSPHKWPVTRKMFPSDDVIMLLAICAENSPATSEFHAKRLSIYNKQSWGCWFETPLRPSLRQCNGTDGHIKRWHYPMCRWRLMGKSK